LNAVTASAVKPTKGRIAASCDPLAGFGELASPPRNQTMHNPVVA
jgi:hypothetical protein